MAGYSFWPKQGWDGIFQDLHDAVLEHGGEVLMGTPVETVLIEDAVVKGVILGRDKVLPNEFLEGEVLEADCVISTLPVWNVLRVVPESALPDWYVGADPVPRAGPPADLLDRPLPGDARAGPRDGPTEIATWLHAPKSRLSGFCFNQTAMDPTTAPAGVNLIVAGGIIPGGKAKDMAYVQRMFELFEDDLKTMYPGLEQTYWRRRHLVHDPSFGVIQKPASSASSARTGAHQRRGAVLRLRDVPQPRDRRGPGGRAGLTVVEDYLGRRLDGGFGWRY